MEWDEIERAMVVVAHPDDAEFGSAGTAARLANDGKDVFYVIVTDGSKGSSDPEMTPRRLSETRREEQCAAARVTGVKDVAFLGFPDGTLEPTLDVRKAIAGAIRQYRPDVLICSNPNRDFSANVFAQHPDHLAAGEATLAAVYPTARDRLTFPELAERGLEPWAVREVWIVGAPTPDFFVDITDTIETKVAALREHKSQIDPERVGEFVPERAKQTGERATVDGQAVKYDFAEAFKRLQIP
ncbi:MAG: PIG-L deacetylase family protein [Chloroflexota bacterium]